MGKTIGSRNVFITQDKFTNKMIFAETYLNRFLKYIFDFIFQTFFEISSSSDLNNNTIIRLNDFKC